MEEIRKILEENVKNSTEKCSIKSNAFIISVIKYMPEFKECTTIQMGHYSLVGSIFETDVIIDLNQKLTDPRIEISSLVSKEFVLQSEITNYI